MTVSITGAPNLVEDACIPDGIEKASILAIIPYPPNRLRPRTLSMLADLASFANLDLLYLDDGDSFAVPEEVRFSNVRSFPNRIWQRLPRVAAGCVLGKPIVYQYYNSRHLIQYLRRQDLSIYHAVYVERIPLQDLEIRHPRLVLDMQDCYSLLVPQLAANSRGLKKWGFKLDSLCVRGYERRACNLAARVLCTAEREARGLKSIGITTPIDVIVHCGPSVQPSRRTVTERTRRVLSFHGKLTYSPNVAALEVLRRQIFQKLDPTHYEVVIAGAGADRVQRRYPEFRFIGYVDDIVSHLRSTDLSVLPLDMNAGISNKALESLAAGIPIISTAQVAAGLPGSVEIFDRGIFVRRPDEFPEAIESYFAMSLADKQDIADNCVAYVENLYSSAHRRAYLRDCVFEAKHTHGETAC